MSSRWYPIYQKGNPQLRVFLPNFWMKMVKPRVAGPPNKVEFIVHNGMSRMDVVNYLEKIYNVRAASIRISINSGKTKLAPRKQYVIKEDDFKVAYVTLPKDTKFEFPDLFPAEKKDKEIEGEQRQLEEMTKQKQQFERGNHGRINVPGWFV